MKPNEQPETEQPAAGGGLEATIRKLKEELAYMTLQRDKLLEMTWLDGPGEPWESTARWKEQFEAGWVRREAADEQSGASEQEPSQAVRLQRMVRRLWETFDRRASTWQRDEGELGDIIATELRTLNNAYLELSDEVGKPPNGALSNEGEAHEKK